MKAEKPVKPKGPVWEKQQQFCREYLIDFNGAAACRRAGYKSKSNECLRVTACRLLSYSYIQDYLNELRKAVVGKSMLTLELVEAELDNMIRFRLGKCFDKNGKLLKIHEMDDATQSALSSIEVENTVTKVKQHNKLNAIALAMKLKGWEQATKLDVVVQGADEIAAAVKELESPAVATAVAAALNDKY